MTSHGDVDVGDTLFGIDDRRHLWIVLSSPVPGQVVVANFTTHDPERSACSTACPTLNQRDHPALRHDSRVRYREAFPTSLAWLIRGLENRTCRKSAPFGPELLRRIQQGALETRQGIRAEVREAIRRSTRQGPPGPVPP